MIGAFLAGTACSTATSSNASSTAAAATSSGGTTSANTSSGTTTHGTTSTGTTTTASSSGGSSGTTSGCYPAPTVPLSDCPSSQVEIRGTLDDFCLGDASPPAGAQATVEDRISLASQAADACGNFFLCLPSESTAQLTASGASGFLSTYMQGLGASQSLLLPVGAGGRGLPLLCTSYLTQVMRGATATYSPPSTPGTAQVLVQLASVSGAGPCAQPGWTISAVLLDGGYVSQNRAYLDEELPPQPISPTSPTCVCGNLSCQCTGAPQWAMVYNLDPTLGAVQVQVQPPAGASCPLPASPFEGSIPLGADVFGYSLVLTP